MTDYIIRASLHDEANEGWVWVEDFPSRSLIKIIHQTNDRSVVCQTRKFDKNFLDRYNAEGAGRIEINELKQNTIVMSGRYRDALGGFGTTDKDNETGKVTLNLCPLGCWKPWYQMRAASHHPDIVVRLGVRLGAIGIWAGLLSIWLGLLSIVQPGGCAKPIAGVSGLVVLLLAGFFLVAACWPPNTSPRGRHE
ncbi:hypothetical protein [Rhizobium phaseoli]|uniref:hypothetical protein n=1 Tax=Rhizobium phaseoli TaxID=396 RepID=UPI001438664F|nr:hypothetical protein [Rhizobium phaseoli]NKE92143.1 hypothetical protein [Rhizobium phaseoli]